MKPPQNSELKTQNSNRRWLSATALFLLGALFLFYDVPGLNTTFFLFGWSAALLAFDGAIVHAGGVSFLTGRRRELAAMMLFSMAYWTVYEQLNLRLENWYYVWVPRNEVLQALYGGLAFATVLPACFLPAEWLRQRGTFDAVRWRALPVGIGLRVGLVVAGALCIVLPMVWPRAFFWAIWGAPLGIPLVLNYTLAHTSLLRDLEQGRPARLLQLLTGGLIAGALWESLNFWARTKWVYTVPGFETGKLFEMPWLGFVGFPVLSVASCALYTLWCHVARSGRDWHRADADQPRVSQRAQLVQMAAVVAFSVSATRLPLTEAVTVRPTLDDVEGLDAQTRKHLSQHWVWTPEALASLSLSDVVAITRLPPEPAHRLWSTAGLMTHKGMGAEAAAWLQEQGIDSVRSLARADADALTAALGPEDRVTPEQIRVWVRTASGGEVRR